MAAAVLITKPISPARPSIYPVLAAMLDHVGGLALVRAVSGLFMLIATGLLFATARQFSATGLR